MYILLCMRVFAAKNVNIEQKPFPTAVVGRVMYTHVPICIYRVVDCINIEYIK